MTINVAEKSAELNAAWPAPAGAEWAVVSETEHTLEWRCEAKAVTMIASFSPSLGVSAWMLGARLNAITFAESGRSSQVAHNRLKKRVATGIERWLQLAAVTGVEVPA
jgi:hypothetical protein